MARLFLNGDQGVDYVYSDETDRPGVEEIVKLIQHRLEIIKNEPTPVIAVRARLNSSQRSQVLKALPKYKRCFQESGNIVLDDFDDE